MNLNSRLDILLETGLRASLRLRVKGRFYNNPDVHRSQYKCAAFHVFFSVLRVAVCCKALANRHELHTYLVRCIVLQCVAVYCSALVNGHQVNFMCVAVRCSVFTVLKCVAVCCRVLQCTAGHQSRDMSCVSCVLQCVAVCCSALVTRHELHTSSLI